jgi:hypothetical protein
MHSAGELLSLSLLLLLPLLSLLSPLSLSLSPRQAQGFMAYLSLLSNLQAEEQADAIERSMVYKLEIPSRYLGRYEQRIGVKMIGGREPSQRQVRGHVRRITFHSALVKMEGLSCQFSSICLRTRRLVRPVTDAPLPIRGRVSGLPGKDGLDDSLQESSVIEESGGVSGLKLQSLFIEGARAMVIGKVRLKECAEVAQCSKVFWLQHKHATVEGCRRLCLLQAGVAKEREIIQRGHVPRLYP